MGAGVSNMNDRLLTETEWLELDPTSSTVDISALEAQDRKTARAKDVEWLEWAVSQCPHGGIDSGGMICLECYRCWQERKKEIGI